MPVYMQCQRLTNSCLRVSVQCSNESVFAADFHPTDCNIIVTCGKSHLYFWNLEKGVLVKKQGLFEVGHQTVYNVLDQNHKAMMFDIETVYETNMCSCVFLQKQEKPKFVLCVTFAENGDAITGDSSGNILVWGKGMFIYSLYLSLIHLLITPSVRLSINLPSSSSRPLCPSN